MLNIINKKAELYGIGLRIITFNFRVILNNWKYSTISTRNLSRITFYMPKSKWNSKLTPEQLHVLRDKGTEAPNTGAYLHNKDTGVYTCVNCDAPLYKSDTKFDSGCGWPAFYEEISLDALIYNTDISHGIKRVEICCGKCHGHLGHVFEGEGFDKILGVSSDKRHCVNSASLKFNQK